jgi:hypothetical protein
MVTALWQGVALEVGQVRIALGPTVEPQATTGTFLVKDDMKELMQTIQTMNTVSGQLLDRQSEMENDLYLLKVAHVANQKLTTQQLQNFSEALIQQIDTKIGAYSSYYALPVGETGQDMPFESGNGLKSKPTNGRSQNNENQENL